MKIQNLTKLVLPVVALVLLFGSAFAAPGFGAEPGAKKTESAACCEKCCCQKGGEGAEKGACCKSSDAKAEHDKCEHGKCAKGQKGEGEKSSCCAHAEEKGEQPGGSTAG